MTYTPPHLLLRRRTRRWTTRLGVVATVAVANYALLRRGMRTTSSEVTALEEAPAIPRRIFQTARTAPAPGTAAAALAARVEAVNPTFARVHFDDAAAKRFIQKEYAGTALPEVYENAPRDVMRADLFRLAVVAKKGGFYYDADMAPKQSLEPLVTSQAVFPLEWWRSDGAFEKRHRRRALDAKEHWQVGNYAFGAVAHHPFVEAALNEATKRCASLENPSDEDVLRSTGPYMLSEVYHEGRRKGLYGDVTLLRGDDSAREGRPTRGGADWHKFGSYAEHLLAHSWVSDKAMPPQRGAMPPPPPATDDATYGDAVAPPPARPPIGVANFAAASVTDDATYGDDATYSAEPAPPSSSRATTRDDDATTTVTKTTTATEDDDDGENGYSWLSWSGPAEPYLYHPIRFVQIHYVTFSIAAGFSLLTCCFMYCCCFPRGGGGGGGGGGGAAAPAKKPAARKPAPKKKGTSKGGGSGRTSGTSGSNF